MYIVVKPNRYARKNTFWDRTEDGWEQFVMEPDQDGISRPTGYTNFILPHGTLDEFVLKIYKRGIDGSVVLPGAKGPLKPEA